MRAGAVQTTQELEEQLNKRGLMNRFLGPLARRVDTPWKMYPIGVLFGLGFDTATEVALLVLAGSAVVSGLPFYAILSLPILFAAGMCLFDTADGCFMNFAYDWAFARPIRKVYYNLTITGAVGVRGRVHRQPSRSSACIGAGVPTSAAAFWVVPGELQHQQGRLCDRRRVRRHVDRRPGRLALRQDRAEVGGGRRRPPGLSGPGQAAFGSTRYAAHCGSPSYMAPISRQCGPRGAAGAQRSVQPSSSTSRSLLL